MCVRLIVERLSNELQSLVDLHYIDEGREIERRDRVHQPLIYRFFHFFLSDETDDSDVSSEAEGSVCYLWIFFHDYNH